MGETYHHIAYGIDKAETAVSLLIIFAVLLLILWLRGKVRQKILGKN